MRLSCRLHHWWTQKFIGLVVLSFLLQACSSGAQSSLSSGDSNSQTPTTSMVDKISPSAAGGSPNRSASSTSFGADSTSSSSSSSNSDSRGNEKELRSMMWLLGTLAVVGAVMGIAYLVTGGDGMFGNPTKEEREANEKKSATLKSQKTEPETEKAELKAEKSEATPIDAPTETPSSSPTPSSGSESQSPSVEVSATAKAMPQSSPSCPIPSQNIQEINSLMQGACTF